MGRSFESVRMGVKDVLASWAKAARAMKKEDQIYALRLVELALNADRVWYFEEGPRDSHNQSLMYE